MTSPLPLPSGHAVELVRSMGRSGHQSFARMVGRTVLGSYRFARRAQDKAFSLAVAGAFQSFGAHSVIQLPVRLSGAESIGIGEDVFVGGNSWLQSLATIPEGGRPVLEIGSGTRISGHCVLSAKVRLRVGRDVLLARNVYVSDHAHAYGDIVKPVVEQGLDQLSPVEIGDGAWLGQNTVVTPGVTIGRGAVIGANSVVTTSIPDFSVAVGAPARVIKTFSR